MKRILGISAFYHDSAAALIADGQIVAAAQEERFTREKHTAAFPAQAIRYCLEEGGCTLNDLDAVVFYDKPLLKFERLLETYYAFAPKGFISFIKAIPVWLREKLFLKDLLYKGLKEIGPYNKKKLNLLFPEHHLSHAAGAYYPSPFSEAAVLTIDGVGEWATASISKGCGNQLQMIREMRFPHSVGLLYSAFTYYLGFRVNSGEYKLMGLAPYGDASAHQTKDFIDKITSEIVHIMEDGSIWLNQKYFNYATGLRMVNEKRWQALFGLPALKAGEQPGQAHCNLAYAIQHITEDIVLKMAVEAKKLTGSRNICLSGGVALNCVANGKLLRSGEFDDIFIQPASGDAGGAMGAAMAAHHLYFNEERFIETGYDAMKGSYLGPDFSEKEILSTLKKFKAVYHLQEQFEKQASLIAKHIANGKVVGWFQGRMEYGPRALGNRSILGDARNLEMQKKLNLKIKQREGFRPFAPAVLAEDTNQYFELNTPSPYMLLVADVMQHHRKVLPENYPSLLLWDKLYMERSSVQAITHVDFSARVQTVHQNTNPRFHMLLTAFKNNTGCGLMVNTSFNLRGEPIVCTPEDAYRCFMGTEMDYLVLGDFLIVKEEQPDYKNHEKWRRIFKPD